jgi:hypothetical protein
VIPAIDRLSYVVPTDPLFTLRGLAGYSGLSRRALRALIEAPPDEALPYSLVGKTILVRKSDFDALIEHRRRRGRPALAKALRELGLEDVPR